MRLCLSIPAHHPWLSPDHRVAAQAAFHVFGMELLAELDLDTTNQFFTAFFRLPAPYWQGFLASRLSSARLILFAAATFLVSPEPSSFVHQLSEQLNRPAAWHAGAGLAEPACEAASVVSLLTVH